MKFRIIPLVLTLMFALVACNSTDTPETSEATQEPVAVESSSSDASSATFSAVLSGSLEGDITGMVGVDVCSAGTTNVTYTNRFGLAEEGVPTASVSLTFAQDTEAGTYTQDSNPGFLSVSVSDPESDDLGYVTPLEWTVELTSVPASAGESYSGSYEITLGKTSAAGADVDAEDTVTVTGVFNYVMDEICE